MRRVLPWVLLGCLVAAGYGLYRWWYPPDDVVIRRLLLKVAASASFGPEESALAKFASVGTLVECFHPDVRITLEGMPTGGRGIQGRDELRQFAAAARTRLSSLEASFRDLDVRLAADGKSASAQAVTTGRAGGMEDVFFQELKFTLVKEDGRWWITVVEPVAALSL